jgi:2-iminobutanoate/2-iminopropanoate deaminase
VNPLAEILDFEPPRRWAAGSRVGDLIFLAGETGTDPVTLETVGDGVEAQAEQAFLNIRTTLERFGADLTHVVKLTVFLTDIGDLHAVGSVRARHLARTVPSSTVEVSALARPELVVEIEAIAMVPGATPD